MSGSFIIRYRLGEGDWQEVPFTGAELIVGRDDETDLPLKHREVSRRHARLRRVGDEFQLTDLDSSNGTQIDGVKLLADYPSTIRPGQVITIGAFTLVLVATEDETYIPSEPGGYQLRYRRSGGAWQDFPLPNGEYIFGRGSDCDLRLDDDEASRQHVRLTALAGEFILVDLGSTNGTQVDGTPLEPRRNYPLHPDQIITIGSHIKL